MRLIILILLSGMLLTGYLSAVEKTKKGETVTSADVSADSFLKEADGQYQK